MKQQILLYLLLIPLCLVAVSCQADVNSDAPPEIVYGEDVCDRCNMIVSEERFASAYWTTDGIAHRFDDIGGMLAHYQDTQEEVASFWVHDYANGDWLNAKNAFFVLDPGLTTPMGFGFAACATEAEAQALAYDQDGAIVLDFDTMMADLESGHLDLDPLDNHSHDTQNHDMEESNGEMSDDMNHDG